jgi:hypothetical protein
MNIIAQITLSGDRHAVARSLDAVSDLGEWRSRSITVGDWVVVLRRQLMDGALAGSTGFGKWSSGLFAWTGRVRNREQVALKLGLTASASIAELLGAALDRWGATVMDHLTGAISLAVVDQRQRRLLWFRDHFGRVPVMRSEFAGGRLWIATTLCAFDDGSKMSQHEVHEGRLAKFLMRLDDSSDQDFFQGVCRIKPGTVACIELGRLLDLEVSSYWEPTVKKAMGERFFYRRVRRMVTDIVEQNVGRNERCCVSLSSGLDSTLLMASWVKLYQEQRVSQPPAAATQAFPNHPETDESTDVQRLADEWRIELAVEIMEDVPPLDSLGPYQDFWGYGPCFHPGETYETEFDRRIAKGSGRSVVISGVGGELLFPLGTHQKLRAAQVRCRQFRDRDACKVVAHLLRDASARNRLWSPQAGRFAKSVLPFELQWRLRSARRRLQERRGRARKGWWTTRTLRLGYMDLRPSTSPLNSWSWELACRMGWRKQLRSGVRRSYPYLVPTLFELASRVPNLNLLPWSMVGYRSTIRRLLGGILPEQLRHRKKHGLFEGFIWEGFLRNEREVRKILHLPHLQEEALVNQARVRRQWEISRKRLLLGSGVSSGQMMGSLAFWAPLSSEIWLRACGTG